ncbi:hypothetical protein B0H10DRAFT_1174906 [Mycena sp. CBHHK59/15]|nr:hypothetical protein B0H10DRAFT_1328969 [Mycena sp. CBHHK59/15]KAJ6560685.1 hypothetical protein B0H10DRAFT_1174906 [Mycena sp. CBHHK59/15]
MLRSFIRNLACLSSASAEAYILVDDAAPTEGPIAWLPPELLHLIICCVDATMLATCSLVCSSWMTHARSRMFSHISISMSNADRFGRLFAQRTRVTFRHHVREIDLDDQIVRDFWTSEVLPKFIIQFPRLTTFSLCGSVPVKWLHPAFQVVVHLELANVWGSDFIQLATFISKFPLLQTLKLTEEKETFVNFAALSAISQPSRFLHKLDLDNPAIFHWIISGTPKPRIDTLCLEISCPDVSSAVQSIRSLSTSLNVLDLNLTDVDTGGTGALSLHTVNI